MKQRIFIGFLVSLFICLQTSTYLHAQPGQGHTDKKRVTDFSLKPTKQHLNNFFSISYHNNIPDSANKLLATVRPGIQNIKNSVFFNLKVNCSPEIVSRLIAELLYISNVLDTIQIRTIPDDVKRLLCDSISEFNRFAMVSCIKAFQLTNNLQHLEMAFLFAEKSKFRILSETMAFKHAMKESGIPVEMLQKETDLALSINQLQNEISGESFIRNKESDNSVILLTSKLNSLFNEKKVLLSNLDKKYPLFHQLRFQPYMTDTKSIQKALSNDQVILNYIFGPRDNGFQLRKSKGNNINIGSVHIYCFIISRNYFLVKEINDSSSFLLTFGIDEFVSKPDEKGNSLSINGYQSFITKSHQLYLNLIEPIKSMIFGKSLLISLDQRLAGLSFDILISEMPESLSDYNFKDLHYLIKEHSISYIFTPGITFHQKKGVHKLHSILAFAPTYKNLKELRVGLTGPGLIPDTNETVSNPESIESQEPIKTKETCNFLKSHYNGLAFLNDSATKNNFLKNVENFDILHLAMHGHDNEANPAESDLVFTPQTNDTGFILNNYEIPFLRLNAGLVILQSCQGGSSNQGGSERLQSPVRNFFVAGIPLGIASAWNLDDFSSEEILKSFYQYFFQGYRADLALSKAKLDFLIKSDIVHTQPYFWASLQCYGNPEAIRAETSNHNKWVWIFTGIIIFSSATFFFVRMIRKKFRIKKIVTV